MMNKKRATRINTLEMEAGIVRIIGHLRARKYFDRLGGLLTLKVNKKEFSKYCCKILGKENLHLHNQLSGAILKNSQFAEGPPLKSKSTAHLLRDRSGNSIQRNVLRTVNSTACDAAELVSLGSRPPVEVASV